MINSHIIQLLAPKIQTFPSGKEFIYLVGADQTSGKPRWRNHDFPVV